MIEDAVTAAIENSNIKIPDYNSFQELNEKVNELAKKIDKL